jgi:preprotein translocase subunit SecG
MNKQNSIELYALFFGIAFAIGLWRMYKQAKSDFEIEKLKAAQWDKQARTDEPTLKSRF